MPPHKESHARQWDTESNLSVASSAPRHGAGRGQAAPRPSAPTYPSIPVRPPLFQPSTARNTPLTQQSSQSRGSALGYSTPRAQTSPSSAHIVSPNEYHIPQENTQQRHGNGYNPAEQRQSRSSVPAARPGLGARPTNTGWAEKTLLVTTKAAAIKSNEALKEAEFASYCVPPQSNEPFASTGYYLWPKGCEDPMALFDPTLKIFNDLRRTYKVHIDWNDEMRCLRINCKTRPADQNVADAIRGIKMLQLNAQALVISASPEYIIVPPTADAVRSIVQPKGEGRANIVNMVVTRLEFGGEPLSAAEKSEWQSRLRQMNEENYKLFRGKLIMRTLPLRDLRGWMRMRVHLGHVNLSQYQDGFLTGTFNFEKFAGMMKKPRVAAGGSFDRKMDAAIAMELIKKIVSREQDFCPRGSTTPTLSAVLEVPKHTEIIFVTTPDGKQRRLEAEIEKVQTGAMGKYQLGHTRFFADDHRNKRMEITTVDIERGFDWTVEIIQDGELKGGEDIPRILERYLNASLDSRSEDLVDQLNLPYPAIALRAPTAFIVTGVVIRSVFQYMWIHTSNIIEIAIYREWDGCNTRGAPIMQASVSMFNPDWDAEMESAESHQDPRNWDRQLYNFFGKDGVSHKNSSLSGLINEIREVQGLLSEAAKVCTPLVKPSIPSRATAPGLLDF